MRVKLVEIKVQKTSCPDIKLLEEFILLLVDIPISHTITVRHSYGISLDLGQVFLHLAQFPFQMISLKFPQINPGIWNERWELTLVLSPASRPQRQPTRTAEYLMNCVELSHGLSSPLASMTPCYNNVHIMALLKLCSEPQRDSETRSITNAWCQS